MIHDKADEVIKELFELLLSSCQTGLETPMIGSDFTFDCVSLLHSNCYEINLNRGGSHINCLD